MTWRKIRRQITVHEEKSELTFFFLLSCRQITKASDSSPAPDPPSLQPSPGHHSVPTKNPVSRQTDIFRKEKKTNTLKNEQLDAEIVAPKLSSQPDTPSTPAAAPKREVSATLSNVLMTQHIMPPLPSNMFNVCRHLKTATACLILIC